MYPLSVALKSHSAERKAAEQRALEEREEHAAVKVVFRSITDRVAWSTLEKELAKFYAEKDKKRKAGEMEK